MRLHFDEQLEQLNNEIIEMGDLCRDAITACMKALLEPAGERSTAAKEFERVIDQKEREIETRCLRLLLQQQPVARDLRLISAAMKMISDMERIGDQASDIEEIAQYIQGDAEMKSQLHIGEMAKATIDMVTDATNSFVKKDVALARSVMDCDDVVDDLFKNVKEEMIHMISGGDNRGELFLDLLMIAKYFERIGDHAVNVAEWVEYSVTGKHPKLGGLT